MLIDHCDDGADATRTVPHPAWFGSGRLVLCCLLFVLVSACNGRAPDIDAASSSQRIVTLGGAITEIVYALGAGERIVGVDISSTWPASARTLPQTGYQRTLSAENVLSLSPTLIIAGEEAGPPAAIEQLRNSGVRVVIVPSKHSVEGARSRIMAVAEAIGREKEGLVLTRTLDADIRTAPSVGRGEPSRVMFIYTRGAGAIQVSGANTAADAMIKLAGARNAVSEYDNYKPLTPEAAIAAAPDVILVPTNGMDQLGGIDAILSLPGIAETPAGKHRRVIAMDDLFLLGFGPRLGMARTDLAHRIDSMMNGGADAAGN